MKKIILSIFLSVILVAEPLFANLLRVDSTDNKGYWRILKNADISGGTFFEGSDLIVWIQDLHLNSQIQKNITAAAEEIVKMTNDCDIYAEGMAKGKADVSILSSIPDETNKEKSINRLYSKGYLSAAEYLALKGYDVYGAEDKNLYGKTLALIEKIIKNTDKDFENGLLSVSEHLKTLKKRYLSKSSLRFTESLEKQYDKLLRREGEKQSEILPFYPNLNAYIKSGKNNGSLPKELNAELLSCLSELRNKISHAKFKKIMSVFNGEDEKSFLAVYEILLSDYPEYLKKYPKLNAFFKREKELSEINKVNLLFEQKSFIKETSRIEAKNNTDIELSDLEDALNILRDYARLSLNEPQYTFLKNNKEYFADLFNKYFEGKNRVFILNLLYDEDRVAFYENNIKRDIVFCEEIFKETVSAQNSLPRGYKEIFANLKNYGKTKIIIAGGFHYGIQKALSEKKISYLILTPKASFSREQNKYNDFIVYGANAFNKVFHADFDYGSPQQVLNSFISVVAGWGGYAVSAVELQSEIEKWISSNEKLSGISVSVKDSSYGYEIKAEFEKSVISADIEIKNLSETEALNRRIITDGIETILSEYDENSEKRSYIKRKLLSLIDPFLKTRGQKLLSSMFMPAVESVLWIPMITSLSVFPFSAVIMPVAFALLHNFFKALALKADGKKYDFKTFLEDFTGYLIPSTGLSAVTTISFFTAAFFSINPLIAIFVASASNICAHYAYEIYAFSGASLSHEEGYFGELEKKYSGDRRKLNMIEALKEAEKARAEEKEIKTFLKPPVGAFLVDENGNKGRGYNREKSLLHAEQFAFISYFTDYIGRHERNANGIYTPKGKVLLKLLRAVIINAETLNSRFFEKNPYLLKEIGYDISYPKNRTIDDIFNETNFVFGYIDKELGTPLSDASLYCTLAPCNKCSKMMSFMGIKESIFASSSINKSHKGKEVLSEAGVKITENVLAEEAEEYIANYKIANKTPARTKAASFIQTVARKKDGLFDFAFPKKFRFADFEKIFSQQRSPSKNIYDNISPSAPDKVFVSIASSGGQYLSFSDGSKKYISGDTKQIVFTRFEFEDEDLSIKKLHSGFNVKNESGSALFDVYSKDNIFYIDIVDFKGFDENEAYEFAYIKTLEELKIGILSPSVNPDTRAIMKSDNISIIAVEGSADGKTNTLLSKYIEAYDDVPYGIFASAENVRKYELFADMLEEIEDLRSHYGKNDRFENRNLLSSSSIGINIASLSSIGTIGKIKTVGDFAAALKGKVGSICISGYMPFEKKFWMDDIYIDWEREGRRLQLEGYDISEEEIESIREFYARYFEMRQGCAITAETISEIREFEKGIAVKFLSKIKNVFPSKISDSQLREYMQKVKELQIKELTAKAELENVDISAEYIYDAQLSIKENLLEIEKILGLFNGIIMRLDLDVLHEISDDVYKISSGKAVAFKINDADKEEISAADFSLQRDYGFRAVRDFSLQEDNYGKAVSVPVEEVNDTVVEKLAACSSVIVSVPETSGEGIGQISEIKNGKNIFSDIMNAARKIKTNITAKTVKDYYLHGINIAVKADKNFNDNLFGENIVIDTIKGRGLLAVLNVLDSEKFNETLMPELFKAVELSAQSCDDMTKEKIIIINDKIKKQYYDGDEHAKSLARDSLRQFVFGMYFKAEIMNCPAFKNYEGEYADRAANYASDIRKHILNSEDGLALDDTLENSLNGIYFMLSADLLSEEETIKLLNYYSPIVKSSTIREKILFAVILGQGAKKYGNTNIAGYSEGIKEDILSYKAANIDKNLYLAAAASIAYIESDNDLKNGIRDEIKDGISFTGYDFNNMLMTITLIELLEFNADLFSFDETKDSIIEKIYADTSLAGLYAKVFKFKSSYSVSGISVELQSVLDGFSITEMRKYTDAGGNIQAVSIAMALTELCELVGYKTDLKDIKEAVKTTPLSAIKKILSAA